MRLFNDATEYGLRAMVWMTNQPRGPHKLQAIAEAIGAAPCYLIKVLQLLTRAGIVSAHRGITGGYALVRDPETLTALEVLSAIDPIERIERIRSCPLGIPAHAGGLCSLYQRIDDSLVEIEREFARITIAMLALHRSSHVRSCMALSDAVACGSACDGSECTMKKERANCEQGGSYV